MTDTFTPHGIYTISNNYSIEVQLSDCNSAARLKLYDGTITDWLKIEFIIDPDNEDETLAVIDPNEHNVPLDQVFRIDIM